MARPSRQPAPSLQAANYLAGQTFYQVVRLGISKYDVSSHDDRYAHLSTQHHKSHEWDASGGANAMGAATLSGGMGRKTAKSSGKKKEATHKSTGRIKGQHGGNPGVDP